MSTIIKANITLFDRKTIGFSEKFLGLSNGAGISLSFEGVYYPSHVINLENTIPPGESGTVELKMINGPEYKNLMKAGDSFLLMSGPTKVAQGIVKNI